MKPSKAVERIREIANLLYNAYGDDIHPSEQLEMINAILARVKETEKEKRNA